MPEKASKIPNFRYSNTTSHMKITMILWGLVLSMSFTTMNAQDDKLKRPSPPAETRGMLDSAIVGIYYSTPAVKGRLIWGGLVPYGKIWRTGANEATVFESDKDINFNGHTLPAGKYALFTIPGEKEWTLVFNSVWDQWGAFKYDKTKDALRVSGTPVKSPEFNERMRIQIENNQIILYWENIEVKFSAA